MMQYGYSMMAGYGFWGFIFWLIVLFDLILLGVWLWKQVQKK